MGVFVLAQSAKMKGEETGQSDFCKRIMKVPQNVTESQGMFLKENSSKFGIVVLEGISTLKSQSVCLCVCLSTKIIWDRLDKIGPKEGKIQLEFGLVHK